MSVKKMVQVQISTSGYIRAKDSKDGEYKANVKDGDQLIIADEGEYVETQYKKNQLNIGVTIVGKEKQGTLTWSPNQTTVDQIAKKYGQDTQDWIGKPVNLKVNEERVGKKLTKVIYGEPVE